MANPALSPSGGDRARHAVNVAGAHGVQVGDHGRQLNVFGGSVTVQPPGRCRGR